MTSWVRPWCEMSVRCNAMGNETCSSSMGEADEHDNIAAGNAGSTRRRPSRWNGQFQIGGLDGRSLGAFRIAIGLNVVYNILAYRLDAVAPFYSHDGIMSQAFQDTASVRFFSIFELLPHDDRQRVVKGKSVDPGGRRMIEKNKKSGRS